jgi:hypothetical protein
MAICINSVAGWKGALIWCIFAAVGLAPLVYRDRSDRHGWQLIGGRIAWFYGSRICKQHLKVAGRMQPEGFGDCSLPGLLAPSKLLEVGSAFGRPFALVHIPATRHYTAIISVDPDGSALIDNDAVDERVGRWANFLADLPHEPGLQAASVTIESAADSGHVLATEVNRLAKVGGPALSLQVLQKTAATYPAGAASVVGRVALTYSAKRDGRGLRSPEEMGVFVSGRLPNMCRTLAGTGVGDPHPLNAAEVADLVATAFEPSLASTIDECRSAHEATGIEWTSAGPSSHTEARTHYVHDGAVSVTWAMAQAPKGTVQATVLEALLAPSDACTRKRVTIQYRPHDQASAAATVDRDVRTALSRAGARTGVPRATDIAKVAAAHQSAAEETSGAGVLRFSALITATVTEPDQLRTATEVVEQLGRASRLRLRRCYGSQSAAFAAALGVGVVLPSHIVIPSAVRDLL